MGSLLYAMTLGFITGYYQILLGALLVILGVIGIFNGMIRNKLIAVLYMLLFSILWIIALGINISGMVKPDILSTFKNEYVIGSLTIKPGYEWFLGGLIFILLFFTPCLCISVCNCATIKNLVEYKQYKKKKKDEKKQRQKSVKPIITQTNISNPQHQNSLSTKPSSLNNRKTSLNKIPDIGENNSSSHTSEDSVN